MHIRSTLILSLMLVFSLAAGCVATSTTKAPELPVVKYQAMAEDQLSAGDMAALTALDLARKGISPEMGAIRLAQGATVAMSGPEPGFNETRAKVTSVRTLQDGTTLIEVLRQYEDGKGRTQMLLDIAGYTLRQPTEGEVQANATMILTDYKAIMKSGSAEAKKEAEESVKLFQQQAGLAVDGMLGPKTAMAMAREAGIQEFSLLASAPAYSQSPTFTMLIMDEVVAKSDPDTYLNGYGSIDAVRTKAIASDQFAARAKGGGNFLALIYFHDQLPVDTAIQLGLSEFENRKDSDYKATMRPVYSTGEGWPLVLAPFKLDRASSTTKKLYAHVILNGSIAGTTKLR